MNKIESRNIKLMVKASILCVTVLFLSQILFIHLRFAQTASKKVVLENISDVCSEQNCISEWQFKAESRFFISGNLMRQHSLKVKETGEHVYPVSRVRGTNIDSWRTLRVYPVKQGSNYVLEIQKPSAVKMDYFIGVYPRQSNNEGVLSIPDISPTISTISSLLGFMLLCVLIAAAYLAPQNSGQSSITRQDLHGVTVCAIAAITMAVTTAGLLDSLMPDGELRSRILRTSAVIASLGQPLTWLLRKRIKHNSLAIALSLLTIALVVNLNWTFFRAGIGWILAYLVFESVLGATLLSRGHKLAAGLTLLSVWDPLYMAGLIPNLDIPPMYLLQSVWVGSFSFLVSDLGAIAVISLASKSYFRFTKDLELSKIMSMLNTEQGTAVTIYDRMRKALPIFSQYTGARRVSLLINLPHARPVFLNYDKEKNHISSHDDGKIPGPVTIRALVYSDTCYFESFTAYSKKHNIKKSDLYDQSDAFCLLPITVNQNNMGVLMLTSFDDPAIEKARTNGTLDEETRSIRGLADILSKAFSTEVIDNLKLNADKASELLFGIKSAIPVAQNAGEFLIMFCDAVSRSTGLRTIIHQKIDTKAQAIAYAGLSPAQWSFFKDHPFNLEPTARRSLGPTVIGFRERKSSYLKDWREISDQLHQKTVGILESLGTRSILAVPLDGANEQFVFTMFSAANETRDPGLLTLIESISALFEAAMTVLSQKGSVLALGRLTNRLIGDDEVRQLIIDSAKTENLPTIIGSPRESFLLLFDLMGSTAFSGSARAKAEGYGKFYDEINKLCRASLHGTVRKTIGDAVIITWDGSDRDLSQQDDAIQQALHVVYAANQYAITLGLKGVRAVLHRGEYFFGLVGTASFGQIDVIGKGIDEVCKLESLMKTATRNGQRFIFAISNEALLGLSKTADLSYLGAWPVSVDQTSPSGIAKAITINELGAVMSRPEGKVVA